MTPTWSFRYWDRKLAGRDRKKPTGLLIDHGYPADCVIGGNGMAFETPPTPSDYDKAARSILYARRASARLPMFSPPLAPADVDELPVEVVEAFLRVRVKR